MWARENCLKTDWKKCESNVTVRTWQWIAVIAVVCHWYINLIGYWMWVFIHHSVPLLPSRLRWLFNHEIQHPSTSRLQLQIILHVLRLQDNGEYYIISPFQHIFSHTSWKYWANRVTCHSAGVSTKQSKLWKSMTRCWCHSESPRTQQVWYFTADCDEISSGFSSPPSRFLQRDAGFVPQMFELERPLTCSPVCLSFLFDLLSWMNYIFTWKISMTTDPKGVTCASWMLVTSLWLYLEIIFADMQ